MKKLMFVAFAAVAAGVAQAEEPIVNKAYVYKVSMDIKTTMGEPCSSVQEIECGRTGVNAFVRVADDYAIRGYIYGCHEEKCSHLRTFLDTEPENYSKLKEAKASGIILWDALHVARVLPTDTVLGDAKAWKTKLQKLFTTAFLNRINTEFDRSEFVFDFNASVELPDAGVGEAKRWYANTFALKGAGFGVYDSEIKKGVWLSQSGALAGTMTAPYYLENGVVAAPDQVYGMNCDTAKCGDVDRDFETATAAYGTWTIEWDGATAEAYAKSYSDALDVPSWVKWEN